MHLLTFMAECELCFSPANKSGFLCHDCYQQLVPASPVFLTSSAIDFAYCSFAYQPPISAWLKAMKDHRQLNQLPKLVWLMLQQPPELPPIDAITYVPSAFWKLLTRGFNPAELIARHIAHRLNIPIRANALEKQRGRDQRTLSRKQRLINSKSSLKAGKLDFSEQHILLIEDVLTTGATAQAAALALKQQGAKRVSVWALAHTQLR